jgi:hypothetical protein
MIAAVIGSGDERINGPAILDLSARPRARVHQRDSVIEADHQIVPYNWNGVKGCVLIKCRTVGRRCGDALHDKVVSALSRRGRPHW